jgi:hypothetical protein
VTGDDSRRDLGYGMHSKNDFLKNRQSHSPCLVKIPAACAYRVSARYRADMERLAQYIIRYPFSVDIMQPNSSEHSIIHRSGMNPKIQRCFEVFSPCDFIARITRRTRYFEVQGTTRT